MDKFEIQKRFMNVGVIVHKVNQSEPLYGFIIDFEPKPFNKLKCWILISNLNNQKYKETDNKDLLTRINHSDIDKIDYQIPYPIN
jgi:hypothetical protein